MASWVKCACAVMALSAVVTTSAHAQYGFAYSVWQNYTSPGDGSPFSQELCAGTTAVINYDNNVLTGNPKIYNWCPPIGPGGGNFGAQFSALLYSFTNDLFQFYVGSDDGSALYIDGVQVMSIPGEQPFSSQTVLVPFLAGSTRSYLLNYYANDVGGSAIQATVDGRLDVSPFEVTGAPEPSAFLLIGSGLLGLGMVQRFRGKPRGS